MRNMIQKFFVFVLATLIVISLTCSKNKTTSLDHKTSWSLSIVGSVSLPSVFDVSTRVISSSSGIFLSLVDNSIVKISLADPANPVILGTGNPFGQGGWFRLYGEAGGYLYAGNRVLHSMPPFSVLSQLPYTGQDGEINLAESHLYLLTSDWGIDSVMEIDISSPADPEVTRRCRIDTIQTFAGRIRIFGQYAYICCWSQGIYRINISETELPAYQYLDTPDEAVDVVCRNNYLYIADRTQGVQIAQAGSDPKTISRIPSSHDSTEFVNIVQDRLVVSDGSLIQVFDLDKPTNPTLIAEALLPGYAGRVVTYGEYLLVAAVNDMGTTDFYVLKLKEI